MKNIDDMTMKEIRQALSDGTSKEHADIKATLVVNCMESRVLHNLGVRYDEERSLLHNLVRILRELTEKIPSPSRAEPSTMLDTGITFRRCPIFLELDSATAPRRDLILKHFIRWAGKYHDSLSLGADDSGPGISNDPTPLSG